MGTHVMPDITSPVTRGQSAATGIVQNIGTSQGSNAGVIGIGNFTNNSIGGTVYNGIQSANQIPNGFPLLAGQLTMAVVRNPLEGGNYASVTDSTNIVSIQLDSESYVQTEKVAQLDAATVHAVGQGNPVPVAGQLPDNGALPKSYDVELPANGVNFPKNILPSATIAAPTQISYEGAWTSPVTGNPGLNNALNNDLVPTAEAQAPQSNWLNGAYPQGVQKEPTNGIPANVAADQSLYQSVQVRTDEYDGVSNNQIPYVQGNDPDPKP